MESHKGIEPKEPTVSSRRGDFSGNKGVSLKSGKNRNPAENSNPIVAYSVSAATEQEGTTEANTKL
jgi:hypothetical protein